MTSDEMRAYKQLGLLTEITPENAEEEISNTYSSLNKVPILFRNTIPEIPSTT